MRTIFPNVGASIMARAHTRVAAGRLACVVVSLAAVVALAPLSDAEAYNPLHPCAPVWSASDLPSAYHVNNQGYSRIPMDTMLDIFQRGFDEWARPCCSGFRARFAGMTDRVGEDSAAREHIFSFRETTWPSQLGDSRFVLAVTLTSFGRDRDGQCRIFGSDMVFNGVTQTYATSHGRNQIDLMAVTVHEQGHWLGLDHTPIGQATMFASYIGEAARTLHPDDEDGVCFLYPSDCGCTTSADCAGDREQCIDGQCEIPPCASDADCAEGLTCHVALGVCVVPPCRSDADCAGRQVCDDGRCVTASDCPICEPCAAEGDCGGGFVCAGTEGGGGLCTRVCRSQDDCPGNSVCFTVSGEGFAVCLNPDANTAGICPSTYVCVDGDDVDLCRGVTCSAGQVCDPRTGACTRPEGDACIICQVCEGPGACPGGECYDVGGGAGRCFSNCSRDADCPGNSACRTVGLQGGGSIQLCMNPDAESAGICPSTFVCLNDPGPAPDRCAGVACGSNERCDPNTGACVPGAGPGPSPDDIDPDCPVCATCRGDGDCGAGSCVNLSGTNRCVLSCEAGRDACPGNTACFDIPQASGVARSVCLNDSAADAGVCPSSFVCTIDAASGGDNGDDPRPDDVEPVDSDASDDPSDEGDAAGSADDEPVLIGSSRGCATASAPPLGAAWLLLFALVIRRKSASTSRLGESRAND